MMAFEQSIICPDFGVSPHPILLQTDIDCTISLLGTADGDGLEYFDLFKDLYLLRKQSSGTLVEAFGVDASLVDATTYANREYTPESDSSPFPIFIENCCAINLVCTLRYLSSSTGSIGFRVSFSSKSEKPVHIYLSKSGFGSGSDSIYSLIKPASTTNKTMSGFVPRGADPTTITNTDILLGARRQTGVNSGRTVMLVSGTQVNYNPSGGTDLDKSLFLPANIESSRDWETAPYGAYLNGGWEPTDYGDLSIVDHDYVFYVPVNSGSNTGSFNQYIGMFAYTEPDPPPAPNHLYKTEDDIITITLPDPPNPWQPPTTSFGGSPAFPPSGGSSSSSPPKDGGGPYTVSYADSNGDGVDDTLIQCSWDGCSKTTYTP
jgi:hypothetical protein